MLMLKSLWSGMTMSSRGAARNSCFAQLNPKAKVREDEEKKFVELEA